MTDLSKAILDKWATKVTPKSAVYNSNGKEGVDQKKSLNYGECGYRNDLVLWIPPKDCLTIEFDCDEQTSDRAIAEAESACKSLKIDYCITGHGGRSDYLRIFNIEGLPLGADNKIAKMLFIGMILPEYAQKVIDKTNLGWTLSPVIGHAHWKSKYNGVLHEIKRGKNPLEHQNTFPSELKRQLEKSKKAWKKNELDTRRDNKWAEDFLLNYCCNNKLPEGERHSIIEKNLAALIIYNPNRNEIIEKWDSMQGGTGTIVGWLNSVAQGRHNKVSAGELANYIKKNNLSFQIPEREEKEVESNNIRGAIQVFDNNFLRMAEEFHKKQPYFYDKNTIWWLWNFQNCCWEMYDDVDLLNSFKKVAPPTLTLTKGGTWAEIVRAMMLVGREKQPKEMPKHWIQFNGRIFDLKTNENFNSTPEYFCTNPIPWDMGEVGDTPTIDKIFEQWAGKANIDLLKEIIAYCMLPDYPIHRIFCFTGSGSNGKSKYMGIIEKFIGEKNHASTELDLLISNRFESANLYKKTACLMGETDFNEIKRTSLLKKLSGGDVIRFEFKNKNTFNDHNYAKILISTNTLPTTLDKTEGYYRRWLIIDFPNKFDESIDILATIPEQEYNNLARICFEKLKKIINERKFTNEGTIEERTMRYEEHSNPLGRFIKEKCEKQFDFKEAFFKFYDELTIYLKQRGLREMTKRELSDQLKNLGYEIEKEHIFINGKDTRWSFIYGIQISSVPNVPNVPHISPAGVITAPELKSGTSGTSGTENDNLLNFTEEYIK